MFYLPEHMNSQFSQDRPSAHGRLVIIENTVNEADVLRHIRVKVVNYGIIKYNNQ